MLMPDRKLTESGGRRYQEERAMTERLGRVVCGITMSADGYTAGLNQTEERPATTAATAGATSCTPGSPRLPRRTGPRSTR
jgi:hypothetical protein